MFPTPIVTSVFHTFQYYSVFLHTVSCFYSIRSIMEHDVRFCSILFSPSSVYFCFCYVMFLAGSAGGTGSRRGTTAGRCAWIWSVSLFCSIFLIDLLINLFLQNIHRLLDLLREPGGVGPGQELHVRGRS